MRHLIKFRTFLNKRGFLLQKPNVVRRFKGLTIAKVFEIWHRYTTQDKVYDHLLKITFQHSDFVRKALLCVVKDNPPLPCESINFINFLFALHLNRIKLDYTLELPFLTSLSDAEVSYTNFKISAS